MKTNLRVSFAVAFGLCVSGAALAGNNLVEHLEASLKNVKSNGHKTNLSSENCANFTGNWSGTCVDRKNPSNTYDEQLIISQKIGCHSIDIDNITVPVGGFASEATSNGLDGQRVITRSGSWNASQTKYTITFAGHLPSYKILASTTFELDGETLVQSTGDYVFALRNDGSLAELDGFKYFDCRYTRH